jgi:DNA-binding GntR family transcriptional regulator
MAKLADMITERVQSGRWTFDTFPTQEEIMAEVGCGNAVVRKVFQLLEQRGVLVRQLDPVHRRVSRLMPPPDDDRPIITSSAAERVAEQVEIRIADGRWAGHQFPLVSDIAKEFGCSLHTAGAALHLLRSRGVVHKVTRERPKGERGRDIVWRPTTIETRDTAAVSRDIEQAVRSGQLGNRVPLPTIAEVSCTYRVNTRVVSELYQRLQAEGVIDQGWLIGERYPVWFRTGDAAPAGVLCANSKPLAVAVNMVKRMPEWLVRRPNGQWLRRLLPSQRALADEYQTHVNTIEHAMQLLVACGILQRAPIALRAYLPVPPADDEGSHGVTFEVTRGRMPSGTWLPASGTGQWRPLPDTYHGSSATRPGQAGREPRT